MLMNGGFVGRAIGGLRQAWFGEYATRLIAVRYESLTSRPRETIAELYRLIDEPAHKHDFENVSYDSPEFDEDLGFPKFHRIDGPIRRVSRPTILPPDLFAPNDQCFWNDPAKTLAEYAFYKWANCT
jgi:sulfotransferase